MNCDDCIEYLHTIISDINLDISTQKDITESDTRAKIITRIFREVLDWHERSIRREVHQVNGYEDYELSKKETKIIIEAKRIGISFELPRNTGSRRIALSTLLKSKDLKEAIEQARSYAAESGIEFACVTNGLQWVIFKTIRRNESWRIGKAIVFYSLNDINDSFVEFWNLLSFHAIDKGYLSDAFSSSKHSEKIYERALDKIPYADSSLLRNTLSSQLEPLIRELFRDLTKIEQLEVLHDCYVDDRMIEGVVDEVTSKFLDTIPSFAKQSGFSDLFESPDRSGAFQSDFENAVERGDYGTTILLLGGIGCGKTTFIHKLFRINTKAFIDNKGYWFYIPFTFAPTDKSNFIKYMHDEIFKGLKSNYSKLKLSELNLLRTLYCDELNEKKEGIWSLFSEDQINQREASFLESEIHSDRHLERIIKYLRKQGNAVVIVIDNMDQRDPEEQLAVYLMAQEVSRKWDAIVIVALREESFFRASQVGAFNAYHNIRYHLASPDVKRLLEKRIDYAIRVAHEGNESLRINLKSGASFDSEQICSFMNILKQSTLRKNPAIMQFIDSTAHGNMREALDMFNQFMVSGVTNVEKMLEIYKKEDRYWVAEHEFIKAIMLGDYQFYKNSRSKILNLFEVSSFHASSNLTSLRLLHYLNHFVSRSHSEGPGYVDIEQIFSDFSDIFNNHEDTQYHLVRLAANKLINYETNHADNHSTGTAKSARITRAGQYYSNTLSGRFQYLDLTSLDTPIHDGRFVHVLRQLVNATQIKDRIRRSATFTSYIKYDEEASLKLVNTRLYNSFFGIKFSTIISQNLKADISRFASKLGIATSEVDAIFIEADSITSGQ